MLLRNVLFAAGLYLTLWSGVIRAQQQFPIVTFYDPYTSAECIPDADSQFTLLKNLGITHVVAITPTIVADTLALSKGIKLIPIEAKVNVSAASPFHVKVDRLDLRDGSGKLEVSGLLKSWQKAELPNLGLLIYPAEETNAIFEPSFLPTGSVAELEVFYTAPEKK